MLRDRLIWATVVFLSRSYVPPVALGAIMRGGTVGCVRASTSDRFQQGDLVTGMMGWQEVKRGFGIYSFYLKRGCHDESILTTEGHVTFVFSGLHCSRE